MLNGHTLILVYIQSGIFCDERPVQSPGVIDHGLMPVFSLYLYTGLSEGLLASIWLPVVSSKQVQCVLKVKL